MYIIYEYFENGKCRIKINIEEKLKVIDFVTTAFLTFLERSITIKQENVLNDFLVEHVEAENKRIKTSEWVYFKANKIQSYKYIHLSVDFEGNIDVIEKICS